MKQCINWFERGIFNKNVFFSVKLNFVDVFVKLWYVILLIKWNELSANNNMKVFEHKTWHT